jgi:hypothetical protein
MYYLAIKNEVVLFSGKCGTGNHNVKCNIPDSERQILQVFSHMGN